MKKVANFIACSIGIIFLAWILLSWAEVIIHNDDFFIMESTILIANLISGQFFAIKGGDKMNACEAIPCRLCPHLVKSKDGRYFCDVTRKEIIGQDMSNIQEI